MERNSHWIKKAGAKSSWLLWLDSDHQKSENKGELSDTGHIFQKVSKLLFFKGSSSNIWFFPDFFIWSFISEYLVVGPIGCRPYSCFCLLLLQCRPSSPFSPLSLSSACRLIELHFGLQQYRGCRRGHREGVTVRFWWWDGETARWWDGKNCDGEMLRL